MLQIIDGVSFIHKQGIVHLDLKPENIMCVNKTGSKIKLIDFGLARRLGNRWVRRVTWRCRYITDRRSLVLFHSAEINGADRRTGGYG